MKEVKNIELDDTDKDILLRQSRLLYPEVEDWVLNKSIEAYINQLQQVKLEEVN